MIIQVKVLPSSGKQEIVRMNDREYKIRLKKPAENNKANLELVKLLRKYFKDKYEVQDIKIIKGLKSKNKIVQIGE
jgi:uncharacterized protein (TIGR00251 family)